MVTRRASLVASETGEAASPFVRYELAMGVMPPGRVHGWVERVTSFGRDAHPVPGWSRGMAHGSVPTAARAASSPRVMSRYASRPPRRRRRRPGGLRTCCARARTKGELFTGVHAETHDDEHEPLGDEGHTNRLSRRNSFTDDSSLTRRHVCHPLLNRSPITCCSPRQRSRRRRPAGSRRANGRSCGRSRHSLRDTTRRLSHARRA